MSTCCSSLLDGSQEEMETFIASSRTQEHQERGMGCFTWRCTQIQACSSSFQEPELAIELEKLECGTGAVSANTLEALRQSLEAVTLQLLCLTVLITAAFDCIGTLLDAILICGTCDKEWLSAILQL